MAISTVVSDLGLLNNAYGPASQGQWNLARGVYFNDKLPNGLVFFYETKKDEPLASRTGIEQIQDSGGRRLAIYEYAYKDGQFIKDLGRKGESFAFNIKFHGLNYQERFNEFISKVCRNGSPGKIVHPVRGQFTVRFKEWGFVHRHDEWNAVTISATFLEDTAKEKLNDLIPNVSADSALRKAIQDLAVYENKLANTINQITSTANLPTSLTNLFKNTLAQVTGSATKLIGQLTATFSGDASSQQLSAQIANTNSASVGAINAGTVTTGNNTVATLPPIFQTGMDQTSADFINSQTDAFVSANQITPQNAVFQANQTRANVKTAINDLTSNLGNDSYDLVLQYRGMMNSLQEAVEACISSSQSSIVIYTTTKMMSIRSICKAVNISYDRQNEVAQLNPYLASINFVPANTTLYVPAA